MSRIRRAAAIVRAVLREIFDESAYERFLAKKSWQPSREAYAMFLREGEQMQARRPRCC